MNNVKLVSKVVNVAQVDMMDRLIRGQMQEVGDKVVIEVCAERGYHAHIKTIGANGWGRTIMEAMLALANDINNR